VLEAAYLFGIGPEKIKVVIHPQAIIHSMVEFEDGVVMAQLSVTDMRIPIQYALTYPERLPTRLPAVNFFKIKSFDFYEPDMVKFPCLGLAYRAAGEGGTSPAVLNAANEACVREFLKGALPFLSIPRVIEKVMDKHRVIPSPSLKEIIAADNWARREAYALINKRKVTI
jgi:1-deoxy-D-xylulose-5-phosphate reductoisomerase